ncbi:membrane transporter, partial [Oryctes borbonicus]
MIWPPKLQGIIVSSYFWGYLFGQLPGARLAEDLSAKWTFYGGVSAHIVGSLLTPLATYMHFSIIIALRVIQGVAGGFTNPAMHCLLTKWAPPHERNTITSFIYNGSVIGTVKRKVVQWKAILTNGPVWVLIVSHIALSWGWYIYLTQLPLYMNMVLKFKMNENGAVTALPFFCMFLFSIAYGKFADFLAEKEKLSITNIRKLSTVISSGIPAICCIVIPLVTDRILAVAVMTIHMTFLGSIFSGFLQVHIDLASNFAGTLMSITNTFATLTGISVPIFVGWAIDRDPSVASWRLIFWVSTGFYVIHVLTFSIFGTSKEQKFNQP